MCMILQRDDGSKEFVGTEPDDKYDKLKKMMAGSSSGERPS